MQRGKINKKKKIKTTALNAPDQTSNAYADSANKKDTQDLSSKNKRASSSID